MVIVNTCFEQTHDHSDCLPLFLTNIRSWSVSIFIIHRRTIMVIIHCYLFTDIRSWLLSSLLSRRHTIIVRIHLCFPQTYDHGNCPPLFVTDVGHAYCPSLFLIGMRLWSFSTLPRTHGEMVIVYPRFSQTRPRPVVESYIYIRNGKQFVTSRPDTGTCS